MNSTVLEAVADLDNNSAEMIKELDNLELALVGGGIADPILA